MNGICGNKANACGPWTPFFESQVLIPQQVFLYMILLQTLSDFKSKAYLNTRKNHLYFTSITWQLATARNPSIFS